MSKRNTANSKAATEFCVKSAECTCAVRSKILCTSQAKANTNTATYTYIPIYIYIYMCAYVYAVSSKQNKSSDLSTPKYLPLTYALENWNSGSPLQDAPQLGALLHFQCKRQPKRLSDYWKVGYVGISVVVSHKYARTQTHTYTCYTYKPWSAASGRSRGSIRLACMCGLYAICLPSIYLCECRFLCAPRQFKNAYFKNNNNKPNNSHHQKQSKWRQATKSTEIRQTQPKLQKREQTQLSMCSCYSFTVGQEKRVKTPKVEWMLTPVQTVKCTRKVTNLHLSYIENCVRCKFCTSNFLPHKNFIMLLWRS